MSNVGYNGQVSLVAPENSTYHVMSEFGNFGDDAGGKCSINRTNDLKSDSKPSAVC
jgi:hypothetical protein